MSRLPSPICETAHPVDVHVGRRIRVIRKQRELSQQVLGEQIGVTFQQLQKYENATNRVSSSKLYLIAQALKVSVGTFYEGLDDTGRGGAPLRSEDLDVRRIAEAIPGLARVVKRPTALRAVRNVVAALVEHEAA